MVNSNTTRPSLGSVMYGVVKSENKESENALSFSSSESSSAGPSPVQMRQQNNPPWRPTDTNEHQQSRTPNFRGGFPVGRGRGWVARGGGTRGGRSDRLDTDSNSPRQIDRYRPAGDDNGPRERSWDRREDGQHGGNRDFQHGGRNNAQQANGRGGFSRSAPRSQNRNPGLSGGLTSADVIAAGTLIRPSPPRERGGRGGRRRPGDEDLVNEFSRDRARDQQRLDREEQLAFAFLCCLSEKELPYCLHCHTIKGTWGQLANHLLADRCCTTSTFKALRSSLRHQTETTQKAKELAELRSSSDSAIVPILKTYAKDIRPFEASPAIIAAAETESLQARSNAQVQAKARIQAQAQVQVENNTSRPNNGLSSAVSTPTVSTSTLASGPVQNNSYQTTGFYNSEEQDKFAFAFLASALEGDNCLQCRMCFNTLKELDGHLRITKHFESQTYQLIQSLPTYNRVLEKAREVTGQDPNSEEKFFELLVARAHQIRDVTSLPNNNNTFNAPVPSVTTTAVVQSRKRKTLSYIPIYIGGSKQRNTPIYKFDEIPETDDFRETVPGFSIRFLLPKNIREKPHTPTEDYRTYLEKRIVDQLSDTNPITKPDLVSIFSKSSGPPGAVYMDLYYSKMANFMIAKERAPNVKVDGDAIPVNEVGATVRLEKYIMDVKLATKPNSPVRPTSFASITHALDLCFKPLGYLDAKVEDIWGYCDSNETSSQMVYLDQGLIVIAGLSFPVAEYKYPRTVIVDGQKLGLELRGKIKGPKERGSGKRARLQDSDQMDLE